MWFLESLDAVHRAIQGSSDLGQALNAALAVLVEVFACDRAWLLEAQGETWTPVMERTRPEYPGGLELGVKLPLTDGTARRHRRVLESDSAVQLNAEEVASVVVPEGVAPPRAILAMAINPKVGRPWILGLHQCSHAGGGTRRRSDSSSRSATDSPTRSRSCWPTGTFARASRSSRRRSVSPALATGSATWRPSRSTIPTRPTASSAYPPSCTRSNLPGWPSVCTRRIATSCSRPTSRRSPEVPVMTSTTASGSRMVLCATCTARPT